MFGYHGSGGDRGGVAVVGLGFGSALVAAGTNLRSWMATLLGHLLQLSMRRRTDRLLSFAFWLAWLAACTAIARLAFMAGDLDRATTFIHLAGFSFLGLLGLALARISVPVTSLVLDPSVT